MDHGVTEIGNWENLDIIQQLKYLTSVRLYNLPRYSDQALNHLASKSSMSVGSDPSLTLTMQRVKEITDHHHLYSHLSDTGWCLPCSWLSLSWHSCLRQPGSGSWTVLEGLLYLHGIRRIEVNFCQCPVCIQCTVCSPDLLIKATHVS